MVGGGGLVTHSSALCHPADICYICVAAGDPWIKRLQEYCHISFNNIIILWGKRCFIPDVSQSLACSFHLRAPFFCLPSLSLLYLPLCLFPPFFLFVAAMPCNLQFLGNLVEHCACVCVGRDQCRSYYLSHSFFFFFRSKAIWSWKAQSTFRQGLWNNQQQKRISHIKMKAPRMPLFQGCLLWPNKMRVKDTGTQKDRVFGFNFACIDHVQRLKEALTKELF